MISLALSDYYFKNKYKRLYRSEAEYAIGKVEKIEGYGRGTGFNFVYIFEVNRKVYKSKCDVGNLIFQRAETHKGKTFLVLYLKNDVYVNRLYTSIPVSANLSDKQLKNLIRNDKNIQKKLNDIPSGSWFWENYF
jgi:hypothetical protein